MIIASKVVKLAVVSLGIVGVLFVTRQSLTRSGYKPDLPSEGEGPAAGNVLHGVSETATPLDRHSQQLFGGWISSAKNRDYYKNFCTPLDDSGPDWAKGFQIVRRERGAPTAAWEELIVEYSTSFNVTFATSVWMEDVLLQGLSRTGESVLEYWTFTPEMGGWSSKAVPASTPIGSPGPALAGHTESISGGAFLPLSTRGTLGRPRKKELYRGVSPIVESSAIDLDLRFVVFIGKNPNGLYMLDLSRADPVPTEMLSETAAPELAQASDLYILQHSSLGRCIVVEVFPDDIETQASTLAVWDHDNDGIVDLVEPFVLDGFYAAYPDDQWRYDLVP